MDCLMGAIFNCVFLLFKEQPLPPPPPSCLMGAILNCVFILFQEQPLPPKLFNGRHLELYFPSVPGAAAPPPPSYIMGAILNCGFPSVPGTAAIPQAVSKWAPSWIVFLFCSRNSRYPPSCLMGAILNCVFLLFQEQPLPEPAAPGSAASHRGVQSGSARLQVPDKLHICLLFYAVLRIHDIVVRIRIRGSTPLTNGSGFGSGSCHFRHWPSRRQQKTNFFIEVWSFSAYYLLRFIYIIFQR